MRIPTSDYVYLSQHSTQANYSLSASFKEKNQECDRKKKANWQLLSIHSISIGAMAGALGGVMAAGSSKVGAGLATAGIPKLS
jgi:hypothetical protein